MKPGSESGAPVAGAWRFVFVMDGEILVTEEKQDGGAATSTTHTLGEVSHSPSLVLPFIALSLPSPPLLLLPPTDLLVPSRVVVF